MSRTVFYLNPEGNTRAVDNIRWGEILRHAAIPINVDTGEHARAHRPTEGFDVWSGKAPPGIYASDWEDAFEQAMELVAQEGALQKKQDELITFRERMLYCLRKDADMLMKKRPVEVSASGQRGGACKKSG